MTKKLPFNIYPKAMILGAFALFATVDTTQAQNCEDPTISVPSVNICSGTSTVLTATTNGTDVFWYDSATSTSSIATGTTLDTEILTADTSFWVEAVNYGDIGTAEVITGGGRVAPTGTSASSVVAVSSPWGLVFDAFEDFELNSVDVFITDSSGGNITINLLDSDWEVLETSTQTLPGGGSSSSPLQHTITLDFDVPQGDDYRLVATTSPNMIREFSSQHPGFPYAIGTVGEVTAGSINTTGANPTLYYFFYNWTVTTSGTTTEECVSERIEVEVTVTEVPDAPTADTDQTLEEGSTIADLVVDGNNLTWYTDAELTQEVEDSTVLTDDTTYYVTQSNGDCEGEAIAIHVTITLHSNTFDNYDFSLYPNPVKDVLHIQANQPIKAANLYNLAGQKLNITAIENQINMNSLAAGSYILQVTIASETQSFIIVKQ